MDNSSSGVEGTILKIEMFYTTLATVDNRTIVIPNGTLSNSCVINVTAKNSRKLEIKVGISYESSIARAKEILEKLLREDPCVMSDQEILVFVDELASNSVVLGLRAWVSTEEYWKTKWRMNEKIKESFEEAGVVIPYPQMDVHIKEPI
jgi:small conductance mechanosensitive channel